MNAYLQLRVGMFGGSGGGYATAKALMDYPDFYKVGVSSAGNHDQRSYTLYWSGIYNGPFSPKAYADINSYGNVAQFRGKLLLTYGEVDDNVSPANTMRVIDAMIRNGKRIDVLPLPNQDHWGLGGNLYLINAMWDYFVEHLQGGVPPAEMVLVKSEDVAFASPESTIGRK